MKPKQGPKVQSIVILGRRWFQRTYGNTYNTVTIIVNGQEVAKLPKEYGYGSMYYQRAGEWLNKYGYVKLKKYPSGGLEPLHCGRDRGEYYLTYTAIDVARERDL